MAAGEGGPPPPPSPPPPCASEGGPPPLGRSLAAGTLLSMAFTTAAYPVHRLKVVLQTQDVNGAAAAGRRYTLRNGLARLVNVRAPRARSPPDAASALCVRSCSA